MQILSGLQLCHKYGIRDKHFLVSQLQLKGRGSRNAYHHEFFVFHRVTIFTIPTSSRRSQNQEENRGLAYHI